MEEDYIIIEKLRSDFQKVLNQWKHDYILIIEWMEYDKETGMFRALIKRVKIEDVYENKNRIQRNFIGAPARRRLK